MVKLQLEVLSLALLVACAWSASVHSNIVGKPFIPIKVVGGKDQSSISTLTPTGKHEDYVTLRIPINDKVATLELRLNKEAFNQVKILANGKDGVVQHQGAKVCHYTGSVHGDPDSSAAISTCNGIEGSVVTDGESYEISPSETGADEHTLRYSDKEDISEHCGEEDVGSSFDDIDDESASDSKEDEASIGEDSIEHSGYLSRKRREINTEVSFARNTRNVELFVVTDVLLYNNTFKRDKDAMIQYVYAMVNRVDTLFRFVNYRVFLTGMELWTDEDKSPVGRNSGINLRLFTSYFKKTHYYKIRPDAFILVSGETRPSSRGVAYRGGVCNYYSAGVITLLPTVERSAFVMGHELGHILGATHYGRRTTCVECPPDSRCIMGGPRRTGPVRISECSQMSFQKTRDHCLKNQAKPITPPVCGNAYVEEGEECDCGTPEECLLADPCCDPTQCKVKVTDEC